MLACRGRPSSASAHLGSPLLAPPRLLEPRPWGGPAPWSSAPREGPAFRPTAVSGVENSSSSLKGPSQMPFLGAVSLLPASSEE